MMSDRPQSIVWGENQPLDNLPALPRDRVEMQHILTHDLGLPESLLGRLVLELFSGGLEDSFKPEVLSRSPNQVASNYIGVDLSESTGVGHIMKDVYNAVEELPSASIDYVIMQHPPIWHAIANEQKWRRENATRLVTPTLADPKEFMKFVAQCSRLIIPKKGNRISVANGFPDQDINAVWRELAQVIPRSNEWYIHSPLTGRNAQFTLYNRNSQKRTNLQFPEHAFQLVHL
jgi:hypothetical protein